MSKQLAVELTLIVRVPLGRDKDGIGPAQIVNAINEALDEPPCDWGEWYVGGVEVMQHWIEEAEDYGPSQDHHCGDAARTEAHRRWEEEEA